MLLDHKDKDTSHGKRLKNVVLSEKLSETIQSYKLTRRRKTKELRLSTLGLYGCEIVRADNKIAASSSVLRDPTPSQTPKESTNL